MPETVTGSAREAEDDLVALVVVPVKGCIPTVGYLILAVLTVKDGLSHLLTLIIASLADVNLGIQIQAHQQCCSAGLGPLALNAGIGTERSLLGKHGDALLEITLDEIKDDLGLNLGFGVLGNVAVAHCQRHIAEAIEQAQVEPRTQHPALGLEVVKLGIRETIILRRELFQVLNHIVALHDTLETAVPFALGITAVFHIPLVVVQATPFATVIPPTVAGRGNQLVGSQLVEHMTALDAPESVFKRTEGCPYHVILGVIIVLGSHLVIQCLVQVGAACQCAEAQGCHYHI